MLNKCTGCGKEWENDTEEFYCSRCLRFYKKVLKMKTKEKFDADKRKDDYTEIDQAKMREIRTRVLADDGLTVLKGKEGLDYMKEHAVDNPGYNQRLREYYEYYPEEI